MDIYRPMQRDSKGREGEAPAEPQCGPNRKPVQVRMRPAGRWGRSVQGGRVGRRGGSAGASPSQVRPPRTGGRGSRRAIMRAKPQTGSGENAARRALGTMGARRRVGRHGGSAGASPSQLRPPSCALPVAPSRSPFQVRRSRRDRVKPRDGHLPPNHSAIRRPGGRGSRRATIPARRPDRGR